MCLEMGYVPLPDNIFGMTYFDDADVDVCDVLQKNIHQEHIEAGTILINPMIFFMRNVRSRNNTIVHECVHWDKHKKCFDLERLYNKEASRIRCQVVGGIKDSSPSDTDWMEWQAKGIAPKILMPAKTVKIKADELLQNHGGVDKADVESYEDVIDQLSEIFDVSRQAAKVRLVELGYSKAEGAYPFIDGRYVPGYAFGREALGKDQTFTISYTDLFKAYCFDRKFRKLLDGGQFLFVDGHLIVNQKKYVTSDQNGHAALTEYALLHMDECCLIFTKGYSYQSKYQGVRYYTQFMRNTAPKVDQIEYSFELNEHNRSLLEQIENAKRRSEALRRYPGSFADTLAALQKEKHSLHKTFRSTEVLLTCCNN